MTSISERPASAWAPKRTGMEGLRPMAPRPRTMPHAPAMKSRREPRRYTRAPAGTASTSGMTAYAATTAPTRAAPAPSSWARSGTKGRLKVVTRKLRPVAEAITIRARQASRCPRRLPEGMGSGTGHQTRIEPRPPSPGRGLGLGLDRPLLAGSGRKPLPCRLTQRPARVAGAAARLRPHRLAPHLGPDPAGNGLDHLRGHRSPPAEAGGEDRILPPGEGVVQEGEEPEGDVLPPAQPLPPEGQLRGRDHPVPAAVEDEQGPSIAGGPAQGIPLAQVHKVAGGAQVGLGRLG